MAGDMIESGQQAPRGVGRARRGAAFGAARALRALWADVALRRTLTLAAALTAGSLWLLARLLQSPRPEPHALQLSWWVLAVAFAAAEVCVFHIEVRREAHPFSLSEVPLVLGLLFASPLSLVVGRLVGELAVLGLHER